MRTKKALVNSMINILSFIILFFPDLVIRKRFLETLGSDLLGLSSLYTNIVGWLSIVEMGIGVAIVYSLYKPFADNNQGKIRAYIRLYGKFYRLTGFIILIVGVAICPFLKFFIKGEIDLKLAGIGFLLFLLNTFISYMFSHRLCILNVAQEAYKVTIGTTVSKLVITVVQVIMFAIYPNFIMYILIQLGVNLAYYIIINMYITKHYPWLNKGDEELEEKEKRKLVKTVKALFMHKIGSLIVFSTDNLVISAFVGLSSLTKFTNYNIFISTVQSIIGTGLGGVTASIGNMLTDNDLNKAYKIHKNIFFINFWVTSFVTIALYNTLHQFIAIWIGENNLLDELTYVVLLINLYFKCMRGSVERFQDGSGQYHQDRYAPICESIINLVASLILVKYIGLPGVFIGTLISNFAVIFWTKPYVVYKYVFKKKLSDYFAMYFKYVVIAIVPLVLTHFLTLPFKFNYTITNSVINCLINIVVINGFYIILFYKTDEFKYCLGIVKRITGRKKVTINK